MNTNYKHDRHGFSGNRFYWHWISMRAVCDIKSVSGYNKCGKLGITYAKRWDIFGNFKDDMYKEYTKVQKKNVGKKLFLTRKNIKKNYSKANCFFANAFDKRGNKKPVEARPRSGGKWQWYESGRVAAKETGIQNNLISNVCHGRRPHSKGMVFRFGKIKDIGV